jgi:hypothetical protein
MALASAAWHHGAKHLLQHISNAIAQKVAAAS